MDDNINDSEANPENPELPKHIVDSIKKNEEHGKMITAIEKELRGNPKYREFFGDCHDSSWDGFVHNYAMTKAYAFYLGDYYVKKKENRDLEYYNEADAVIWEIQQKKLFNYQCLWRAEKVKTEHVELVSDFIYWGHKIKNCPFIEPISEEEVAMYKSFLETTEVDDYFDSYNYYDWQDYETYKEEASGDAEAIAYPDWYEYYDMRMGTGALLLLPDIRYEKEQFYLNLYHEDMRATHPQTVQSEVKTKEFIKYYDYENVVRKFAEKFEDARTLKYMDAYRNETSKSDNIDFELFVHKLCEINEVLPIESHYDWKIALSRAYNKYVRGKIINQLDNVFRDYQSKINMGIGFAEDDKANDFSYRKDIIIKARVLNGEPPDLNF